MISAYIHVPFCVNKCLYCGFYSTQIDTALADQYLSALENEMKGLAPVLHDRRFTSVYIGGGTPTTLSLKQTSRLFDLIEEHIILSDDAEVTIEANPNTATAESLSLLQNRGVNRLSIGVQSLSDTVLASLGRAHSATDAIIAFRTARATGFGNIGIDLIYGVPGQREQQWRYTLEASLSLGPEHISVYSLSLDEGSRLSREVRSGKILMPDEDVVARMYDAAVHCLTGAGYRQYEISNFCIPGRECRHNNNYWTRGEYLGFGPGATSFMGNRRYTNIANVREYISRMSHGMDAIGSSEVLERDQEATELLLLGLRLTSGIDLDRYGRVFGRDIQGKLIERVRALDKSGLFKIDGSMLSLTMRGFMLSNSALTAILP